MMTDSDQAVVSYLGENGQRVALISAVDGTSTSHILFCPGFHSTMFGNKAEALAAQCQDAGWSCTRFDYRGHGLSDGDPESFDLDRGLEDTLAVIDHLSSKVIIVGSSMGAWLATLAALHRPDVVQSLLLLAAAPDFTQRLIEPELDHGQQWDLQQGGIIRRPSRYGESQPLSQALLDSGRRLSLFDRHDLEKLTCPVRLLHGTEDQDVPFSLSVELLQRLSQSDAQLTLINGADHRLSDERCLGVIAQVLMHLIDQSS